MREHHPVLKASQLSQSFRLDQQTLLILQEIDLTVNLGDSVAIIGPSGSGKTSLLNLLAGIDKPKSGEIFWGDHQITRLSEDARALLRREWVSFIFQDFQLMDFYTVLENASLPLEIQEDPEAIEKAKHWLDAVGLSERLHHTPAQLSGGEQQRVAIARAFAMGAKLLFADEPTGNLDEKTGASIIELLFELQQAEKTTLIIVTHDKNLADRCDRQFRLREGRLQCID